MVCLKKNLNRDISIMFLNDAINTYTSFDLYSHSIILGWRGSVSHGTYVPKHIDDKDIMGVIIPPKEYYLGLKRFGNKNTKEIKFKEWDIVFYEFKKYINLLLKSNPNVLALLWLKEEFYIHTNKYGKLLIENRDKFLSKKVYESFSGYAYAQLKKMTHFSYAGYMGQKRKELVDKFGYDSKNASHSIRLLKMGIECLETGTINVYREKDKNELLDIKHGKWSLEKIKEYADKLFIKMENALKITNLPDEPDYKAVEDIMMDILTDNLCQKKETL